MQIGEMQGQSVVVCTDRDQGLITPIYRTWPQRFAWGYIYELEHFVHCILNGESPKVGGRDGRWAVAGVLAGTKLAEEKTMNSCCHGAGRVLSRSKARKQIHGQDVVVSLSDRGIKLIAGSPKLLSEEAPQAYKDVNVVVDTIEGIGIAQKVALLTPIAVVKG